MAERLSAPMREGLDALVAVDDDEPHSPLNRIKASSSNPSVGGMKRLLARLELIEATACWESTWTGSTRTIGTSVRYYHANGLGSARPRRTAGPGRVPQGFAQFVGIPLRGQPPRSYVAEPPDNVTHWTVYDRGGHFPAIEEPDLLVPALRTFFRPLRPA